MPLRSDTRRAELRARLAAAGFAEFVDLDELTGPPTAPPPRRVWPLTVLVLLTVVVLLTAGGTYLFQRYTASVNEEPLLGRAAVGAPAPWSTPTAPPEANTSAGAAASGETAAPADTAVPAKAAAPAKVARGPAGTNVLLVGVDARAGSAPTDVRSDTIMIAHITANRDHVYLVSVPRDSRVVIPTFPRAGYHGGIDKINAAYRFGSRAGGRAGGVELLGLTLRHLIGVGFDAAAVVNFDGLRAAVDAMGGVDLCVDEETTSVHVGWNVETGERAAPYTLRPPDYDSPLPVPGMRPQVYHVGCRHFTGWQALDYVRQRELIPDGDYGRQRHQQQLIRALAGKVTAGRLLTNPVDADRMLRALGGGVAFDGNGKPLTDWILALRHLGPDDLTLVRTNGGRFASRRIDGRSFEIVNDSVRALFEALRTDTVAGFLATHPDWVAR